MQEKVRYLPRFCTAIVAFMERLGPAGCRLNSILVLNILVRVVLRYALGVGKVWLDVFHRNFSETNKEYIDLFGMIFMILPFFSTLFYHGLDFPATFIILLLNGEVPLPTHYEAPFHICYLKTGARYQHSPAPGIRDIFFQQRGVGHHFFGSRHHNRSFCEIVYTGLSPK